MHEKCGCMQGEHIWDLNYEEQVKSERFCSCCEHFFLSVAAEDSAADSAIELQGNYNKSPSKNSVSNTGLNKGKIRRRG